jgi:hypothetical protein
MVRNASSWPAAAILVGALVCLLAVHEVDAAYSPQLSGETKEYNFTVRQH